MVNLWLIYVYIPTISMGEIQKLRWYTCSAVDWLSATGGLRGAHGGFMSVWCAAWLVWFEDFGPKPYIPGPDECPWVCGRFWSLISMESWLVVWNMAFIFPYLGNNHPNWLSYFSEGLNPQTSFPWNIFQDFRSIVAFHSFYPKLHHKKTGWTLGRFQGWPGGIHGTC